MNNTYIPPVRVGRYREDCPVCGGKNTLSVTVESVRSMWFCFKASCGFKGRQGGFNEGERPNVKGFDVHKAFEYKENYISPPFPVYDHTHTIRGCVFYAEDDTISPKRIMHLDPSYPALHFPKRVTNEKIMVAVEDLPSAEILAPYFPTIALLGTVFNEQKANYLTHIGITGIYLALDNDAIKKALHFHKNYSLIKGLIWLDKDVKNCDNLELKKITDQIERLNK